MQTSPLPSNSAASEPLVSFRAIGKRFGRTVANHDVSLDLFPGSIHALLGENGAGKSTLMSILAGRYKPDQGTLVFQGKETRFNSPAQALAAGVGMVHQRFLLVEPFTVAENILLGLSSKEQRARKCRSSADVRALAQRFSIKLDPDRAIHDLSMGERQQVEILKLLVRDAQVLILDEPTAILAPSEIEPLLTTLRSFRDQGRTIVFISHKLQEVLDLADHISVLRKGRIMAANLDGATVTDTAELARMMVGHDIALNLERVTTAQADAILEVHGLSRDLPGIRAPFREVSFSVRQGEVFSVTGVAGNGQSDLAAVLGGMKTGAKGTVILKGRRMAAGRWNPAKHDAAYVPEDRYQTGSVPDMSLTDNFLLSFFQEHSKGGLLQRREARRKTENLLKEYGVAATGPEARAGSLSGGNLQKFILGRELSRKPVLFIAEQPTQGLDVQAVADIWQTITRAKQHMAVLLFTNDLEEALALSDRIGVMFRGRMLDILDVDMPTATAKAALVERIGLLMAGMVLPDKPGQGARP